MSCGPACRYARCSGWPKWGELPAGATAAALPDFVLAQLCGAPPATEPTIAAAQGMLDLAARDWHMPLLEALGLGRLELPAIHDLREASRRDQRWARGGCRATLPSAISSARCLARRWRPASCR